MKTNLLLAIIAFILGFFAHALFFPEFLANGISDISQVVLPNTTPTLAASGEHAFMTKVTFDGQKFSKHNLTIEAGSYLIITNTSKDTLMWLTSNNPLLKTPRGYGESEAVQVRIEDRGQYVVADKNNPQERMSVTVK